MKAEENRTNARIIVESGPSGRRKSSEISAGFSPGGFFFQPSIGAARTL
jgi:hypothetical protein